MITERDSLVRTELEDRGNCRFVSPQTAIALVSLYLRSAGQYYYVRGGKYSATATAPNFYNLAAEHVVPSLGAFLDRGVGTVGGPRLLTVQRRTRSLLQARDHLALLVSGPATDESADAIEVAFSHAVVDMVAVHDVLARVANEIMREPATRPREIKWRLDWRTQALEEFPALASAWSDGGPARELNSALRVIRNEIHDVAPIIAPYRTRWGAPQVGLGFLEGVTAGVEDRLRRLDWRADRGVAERLADGMVVSPLAFFEFVFPWMLQSIDSTLCALMDSLPERESRRGESWFKPEAVAESVRLLMRPREITVPNPVPDG